ncbi:cytochrome c family protein [Methylocystis parvus OBBP]|nr:cytochrome c3 family protein [Methylocystis parvus]WBJ99350.1 cytochrome c family protein [Methylocystis parvus OBBP]
MTAAFTPRANLFVRAALVALAATAVIFPSMLWLWQVSDYGRNMRAPIAQPAPFSHEHHVSGLGLDCRYCHNSVETAATAGMPTTYVCMTCHSQIWTDAEILAPVRQSLANDKPLEWRRVTDLPDYVYFDHSVHIAKGVGCASCHGDVARMPLTWKARTLTMQFCLDCHRNPGPNLRPKEAVFDTGWRRGSDAPAPQALLAQYQLGGRDLAECSICHR